MPALVRALKRVDLPTLGRPTMPHLRLMEGREAGVQREILGRPTLRRPTTRRNGPALTVLQTLQPHAKDLGGGFTVRRLLPSADRRAVGPFVFFDHFGPIDVEPGAQHDVRPHPHIGLATLTYLLEGAILHRDSTSVVQRIEPGAVNWMSAGRGIVHSERTPKELVGTRRRSHGLQLWIALP